VTVAELDANPPRLRRADGLMVQFPVAEDGSHSVIEVGYEKADSEFALLFRWRGFAYQELQPGVSAEALLVGHVPGGGYSSAVVRLDEKGVGLEFADRVTADAEGIETIRADLMLRSGVELETASEADVRLEVSGASGTGNNCLVMTRKRSQKPFTHRHVVTIGAKPSSVDDRR
jgi:hypothetical protein